MFCIQSSNYIFSDTNLFLVAEQIHSYYKYFVHMLLFLFNYLQHQTVQMKFIVQQSLLLKPFMHITILHKHTT